MPDSEGFQLGKNAEVPDLEAHINQTKQSPVPESKAVEVLVIGDSSDA